MIFMVISHMKYVKIFNFKRALISSAVELLESQDIDFQASQQKNRDTAISQFWDYFFNLVKLDC